MWPKVKFCEPLGLRPTGQNSVTPPGCNIGADTLTQGSQSLTLGYHPSPLRGCKEVIRVQVLSIATSSFRYELTLLDLGVRVWFSSTPVPVWKSWWPLGRLSQRKFGASHE
jgi:hypothetical protein